MIHLFGRLIRFVFIFLAYAKKMLLIFALIIIIKAVMWSACLWRYFLFYFFIQRHVFLLFHSFFCVNDVLYLIYNSHMYVQYTMLDRWRKYIWFFQLSHTTKKWSQNQFFSEPFEKYRQLMHQKSLTEFFTEQSPLILWLFNKILKIQ